jgi:hypothetical protein
MVVMKTTAHQFILLLFQESDNYCAAKTTLALPAALLWVLLMARSAIEGRAGRPGGHHASETLFLSLNISLHPPLPRSMTDSVFPPPPSKAPPASSKPLDSLYPCSSPSFSIPRTIHFIWLGSPLSETHTACLAQWQSLNPDYDVLLHTDASMLKDSPHLPLVSRVLSSQANYGVKSDVLRLALLHSLGGVYADVDVIPLQPLDSVLSKCGDFLCGAANVIGGNGELSNSVLASSPNHALLEYMLSKIEVWWTNRSQAAASPPPLSLPSASLFASFLTPSENACARAAFSSASASASSSASSSSTTLTISASETFASTGPGLLTAAVDAFVASALANDIPSLTLLSSKLTVLPYYVFQPLPNYRRSENWKEHVDAAEARGNSAVAVHLWECGWMPPQS